ncbi:MAG: site-2 protease family protein [Deltaproteobacteria bacterium]|nr:site-2 protease family protein [Deltaproteobacteria bacterium]
MLRAEEQPDVVQRLMNIRLAVKDGALRVFRGPLLRPPDEVMEKLSAELPRETLPLLQQDERLGAAIVLMPLSVEQQNLEKKTFPWVNWLLFGLTFLTTTWAGAAHQGINLLENPAAFAAGLPYSIALLGILGVHEMGHYLIARSHKMNVTPPYFIPVPFALGTFGAFIKMKSPPQNRTAMFDVAVAGPLAGLAVAVPALMIGLQNSIVVPGAGHDVSVMEGASAGSSIMLALIAKVSLGQELQSGCVLRLSPLAFAGWLGLIVTALNLLPIGQLDGGHTARAMFGTSAGRVISGIAMWSLVLLGLFVWPGLLTWAIIVYFIAGEGTPPQNDLTPIQGGRFWLGTFTFFILVLIAAPLPRVFWDEAGIYCPYL